MSLLSLSSLVLVLVLVLFANADDDDDDAENGHVRVVVAVVVDEAVVDASCGADLKRNTPSTIATPPTPGVDDFVETSFIDVVVLFDDEDDDVDVALNGGAIDGAPARP